MRFLLTVYLCLFAGFASADDLSALKQPGVVALMRHALAPGTGDPSDFALGDCATQRNLDARGRDQARRTGQALRAAGVTFGQIWTSQWCRTRDTAHLLNLGEVTEQPTLNSFYAGQGDAKAQTEQTLELIQSLPTDARLLIVTHQVNITALTGLGVSSGEIIIARRTPEGLAVSGRFMIAP
ncbi:Phosphohistidine phosphatase SixA [Roseovarius marisflavi]|uniref:Phosphohistidine phosphatase SixA n=1 Tax=Roseovarius marisflavi TaxID=1054996 RepID=A0A1M6ZWA0_9RHOB|nr:histidine phosphatase family protein [Roseovarius marisflavi]SHL34625.1 Phosphohistidine phosphatase SixA [Roseovarius marisflavi]